MSDEERRGRWLRLAGVTIAEVVLVYLFWTGVSEKTGWAILLLALLVLSYLGIAGGTLYLLLRTRS